MSLRWSWLATPYLVCAVMIFAVALTTALVRGDRVLRLGVIGAALSALPWATSHATAACTDDPNAAWLLLRLGQGTVAMVGPNLLLVLLGVAGQLERYRNVARFAAVTGFVLLLLCWSTTWTVPGVQLVPSGIFYIRPGPLTAIHVSQLVVWLVVGAALVRRAAPEGERRRTARVVLGVLAFAAVGALDSLLLLGIWGSYPIAWLPATIAAVMTLYLLLRTDFIRPQGFDRATALEMAWLGAAFAAIAALTYVVGASLTTIVVGGLAWATCTGVAWSLVRSRPVRIAAERELEDFVARAGSLDTESVIHERLSALWSTAIPGLTVHVLWWRDGSAFTRDDGTIWELDPALAAWFVEHPDALAITDLATMRVGPMRAALEALAGRAAGGRDSGVVIPIVDRDELVGFVEATPERALREGERGLIADSARIAARALTFLALARAAGRERETAREVEVADALRRQATASGEAELGRWAVGAEYVPAPRTTGAGWSAIELVDGRLALLVTEAGAQGVAAALATAALTGAFAAATAPYAVRPDANADRDASSPMLAVRAPAAPLTLDALIALLRASSEGVLRGGQPVAAFLAILDGRRGTIEYTCAGHPGAHLVGPIAAIDGSLPLGSARRARPDAIALGAGQRDPGASMRGATRETAVLPPDTLVVVASTALRGDDDAAWSAHLRDLAFASGRLAGVLVARAADRGAPREDLLAVIVRAR